MKKSYNLLRVITIILLITSLYATNTPYSYSYIPKFVYKNQVFPVTILAKHYNPNDPLHFEYDIVSPLQPLNPKPTQLINKDGAFFTFYFKADTQEKSLTLPQLSIWNLSYTYMLHPQKIEIKDLDNIITDDFSNIIASNLRVNSIKVDPYDENNSLVTLKLEANEANLEDIRLPNVTDDGTEDIKRDGSKVTGKYYFIIPSSKKYINLTYYNLIKNRMETKKISLINKRGYADRIELKPKDLDFEKIKRYILIGLTLLFIILLILTKDKLYLFISIVLISLLIYVYYPKKTICIQEGASLYILPTQNSNISKILDKQIDVTVKRRYKNFSKIEYKNSISGWVKDEDLCKN